MQTMFNRRVLAITALVFAAVAVAIVLFAIDVTSTPVWIGFAAAIAIALFAAFQLEGRSASDRSNLR